MKDIFDLARLKIKKKFKSINNLEKNTLSELELKYPFAKKVDYSKVVDKIDQYESIDNERSWQEVNQKISSAKQGRRRVFAPYLKYAAAVLLLLAFFFYQKNTEQAQAPIVVENNIKTGSNKANLILEDGSVVVLGKGKTVTRDNLNSDGEELVYSVDNDSDPEIRYNYLVVPRGGQFFVKLSDGTKVWMNSESKLKYPISFTSGKSREVELVYGEAYFEVSPSVENEGAGFKVLNTSQEIEVLGTHFNVKAYKDENNIYTTLVEGEVMVNFENRHVVLKPNEQSNLDVPNKNVLVSTIDVSDEISWRKGIFSFKNKSLKEIMKVLERWYDMEVIFENKNIEQLTFKGVLGKDQEIEEILRTIKALSIIENYKINDRTITLR